MTKWHVCTRSASKRWPLAVWGNILDIAAINGCAIYAKSTPKSEIFKIEENQKFKNWLPVYHPFREVVTGPFSIIAKTIHTLAY